MKTEIERYADDGVCEELNNLVDGMRVASLGQLLEQLNEVIRRYGRDRLIRFDAGHNNISVDYVKPVYKPEPKPKAKMVTITQEEYESLKANQK